MDFIRTGLDITKTIKNVARLKKIITVLAMNGFDELLLKTGIHTKIPGFVFPKSKINLFEEQEKIKTRDWWSILGYRLRKSFEELGPTFIKLGQLISTREDMFDKGLIKEMKKLLDNAQGLPFKKVEKILEKNYHQPLNEIFKKIHPSPIGKASIGVVYRGELIDGTEVVVKVRRPNIGRIIQTDISILLFLTEKIENVIHEIKYLGISKLIQDFSINIQNELNFNLEILNRDRLQQSLNESSHQNIIYFPHMYPHLSSEEVLVMEYIQGIPFSNTHQIVGHLEELRPKILKGVDLFIRSLLLHGIFHADLHGGNFFLKPNGQIGIIDFGLVGVLGKKERTNLMAILFSLVNFDFEALTYEFLEVAEYDSIPDVDFLVKDMKEGLNPFIGLTVAQIQFEKLLGVIVKILGKHKTFLPREWFNIFRALMLLDGVGKNLKIDLDILKMTQNIVKKNHLASLVSKEELLKEGLWVSRNALNLIRIIPRHIRWFSKEWSKNNYCLEIKSKGYEKEIFFIGKSIVFAAHLFLSSILFICAIYLGTGPLQNNSFDFPIFFYILLVASIAIYLKGHLFLKKKLKKKS